MTEPKDCKCLCHEAPKEETKTCPPHSWRDAYYNVVDGQRQSTVQHCITCDIFQTVPYEVKNEKRGPQIFLNNNDRNPN